MRPLAKEQIFKIEDQSQFIRAALDVFRYQAEENEVFRRFTGLLGISPQGPDSILSIPFLPAGFFRNHKVITGDIPEALYFESSGTTSDGNSRHYVVDPSIYRESFLTTFTSFYGSPADCFIAALLPSYTARANSSLVYMADELIRMSNYSGSGFYGNNPEEMLHNIEKANKTGRTILILGVSFALLDLAEKFQPDLSGVIVMETGGMKGRRKEITRSELHAILKKRFNISSVHSEYGMTELLSQAYSQGEGLFRAPRWMKILIRDPRDPLSVSDMPGKTGGINIIDLANIHSCSFIATDDLGRLNEDGSFEVLGRIDNSDIRGCNLLIE